MRHDACGYTLLQSQGAYALKSDTTYYVSGPVNLGGSGLKVTFEGGTVVKYSDAGNAAIYILSGTALDWQAGPYRPVILTAKDDNSVGQTLPYSTGQPWNNSNRYAQYALSLNGMNTDGYELRDLRIAYARTGLHAYYHNSGKSHIFRHAQIVNCTAAMTFDYGNFKLLNALVVGAKRVFDHNYAG